MDEHRWKVNGREVLADRLGIKYQLVVGRPADYIVGGTVCNEEILRLAEGIKEADTLLRSAEKVIDQGVREIALLRRERALLIELEKTRTRILAMIFERGALPWPWQLAPDLKILESTVAEIEALHLEASEGVERPPGVGCACVLCRPEGDLRAEYNEYREAARTLGMREVKLSDLPDDARRMVGHTGAPGNNRAIRDDESE